MKDRITRFIIRRRIRRAQHVIEQRKKESRSPTAIGKAAKANKSYTYYNP